MTPREKAVEILGHQAGCVFEGPPRYEKTAPFTRQVCTCAFPLHVLIAAERGRLRKEHRGAWTWGTPEKGSGGYDCFGCGVRISDKTSPGPCAPPLTPALALELLTTMPPEVALTNIPSYIPTQPWEASYEDPKANMDDDRILRHRADPKEAVASLYLALAEAGLLRRGDAD